MIEAPKMPSLKWTIPNWMVKESWSKSLIAVKEIQMNATTANKKVIGLEIVQMVIEE